MNHNERIPKDSRMTERARELRRDMTPQENRLWYEFLRKYPVKFYKQKIIESFIADFYCAKAKLAIELDGSQHYTEDGLEYDRDRSAIIAKYNIYVMRFTNRQVMLEFDSVCRAIDHEVRLRINSFSRED